MLLCNRTTTFLLDFRHFSVKNRMTHTTCESISISLSDRARAHTLESHPIEMADVKFVGLSGDLMKREIPIFGSNHTCNLCSGRYKIQCITVTLFIHSMFFSSLLFTVSYGLTEILCTRQPFNSFKLHRQKKTTNLTEKRERERNVSNIDNVKLLL